MRKISAALTALLLVLGTGGAPCMLPLVAQAAQVDWQGDDHSISLYFHGYQVSGGVTPQMAGGTVMVPIRYVAMLMGWDCDWNSEDRVFTLYKRGTTVDIPAGGDLITKRDRYTSMGIPCAVPPRHYAYEMLIPLETVEAVLGLRVTWDPAGKRVSLGAYDVPARNLPGWRQLEGDPYAGMYEILFLVEGTGNYLRYKSQITPINGKKMDETFSFTDLSGNLVTKTRGEWYDYFQGLDEGETGLSALYRHFGDFYDDWRNYYREPNPDWVLQDYLSQMYGPLDDQDSSWCLKAALEVDGGYYTGYNPDLQGDRDELD